MKRNRASNMSGDDIVDADDDDIYLGGSSKYCRCVQSGASSASSCSLKRGVTIVL